MALCRHTGPGSGFGDFKPWRVRKAPAPPVQDNIHDPSIYVETVADIRERRDFWWTAALSRNTRRCIALRMQRPQLIGPPELRPDAAPWRVLESPSRCAVVVESTENQVSAYHAPILV